MHNRVSRVTGHVKKRQFGPQSLYLFTQNTSSARMRTVLIKGGLSDWQCLPP
jgi:hypothetical protein